MANMSYCRFENTYSDLLDCKGVLEEFIDNQENVISEGTERRYAKELIELCRDIADSYETSDIDRTAESFKQDEEEEDEK